MSEVPASETVLPHSGVRYGMTRRTAAVALAIALGGPAGLSAWRRVALADVIAPNPPDSPNPPDAPDPPDPANDPNPANPPDDPNPPDQPNLPDPPDEPGEPGGVGGPGETDHDEDSASAHAGKRGKHRKKGRKRR